MSAAEKLHFKLALSGTYWDKKPQYTILVDDQVMHTAEITAATDTVEYVEFDADLAEGSHTLKIRLENKDFLDTVESEDKSTILKDMLLNLHSVDIDDINLGDLITSHSRFNIDQPFEYNGQMYETILECTNMGMNGTYVLEFDTPFYIWLLENL